MAAALRNRCKGRHRTCLLRLPQTNPVSKVPAGNPPRRGYGLRPIATLWALAAGPPPEGGDERGRTAHGISGLAKTATERPATARFSLSAAGPERADAGGGPTPGRLEEPPATQPLQCTSALQRVARAPDRERTEAAYPGLTCTVLISV